jgi:hypothetical protein
MEQQGPRSILDLSRAITQANEALKVVAGDAAMTYPVAEDIRREAGFTEAEIAAARAQVGS